jgi:lysyl-tRNA synthetase class I
MKNKTLWKSFKADFQTNHGPFPAKIGEWAKVRGPIKCCNNGFHASKRAINAMQFVNCEIIALVEVRGESDHENDKTAHAEMRIKKAYKWTKRDSVELAVFAAEQVIKKYEKKYPNDDRPRKAIEAAKEWLKNPTAAHAAYAAYAADAAHAAYAAAEAAYAAAEAAYAAEAKILDKCEDFIQSKIKMLEAVK